MIIIPDSAIKLVASFEGLRLEPYLDSVGCPTIGYGHKILAGEGYTTKISQDDALSLLKRDLGYAANMLLSLTKPKLTENQFIALLDFVFNLGAGAYQHSTLRMKINRGEFKAAQNEFSKWIYAGAKKLPGLIKRRAIEARIFASQ